MAELIALMGIPASGKSTFRDTYNQFEDYVIVCPDDIRQELTGNRSDQSRNDFVFANAHTQTWDHLEADRDVIFDATNVTASARAALLEIADKTNASRKLFVLRTPFEDCLERNAYRVQHQVPLLVMYKMHARFVRSLSEIGYESWNAILNVEG